MRGYKNVIGKGMELNQAGTDCALMMETSGHGALAENHFLDDGAYLAVKAIVQLVRLRLEGKGDLGAILDTLPEPQEAQEIRMKSECTVLGRHPCGLWLDEHGMLDTCRTVTAC